MLVSNFIYTIDVESDEPIMLINKHIGNDDQLGQGIDGSIFQAELLRLDTMGKKRIQVWISSEGGIVMDGYKIYNAILKSKTKVDTYNVGICASIAIKDNSSVANDRIRLASINIMASFGVLSGRLLQLQVIQVLPVRLVHN